MRAKAHGFPPLAINPSPVSSAFRVSVLPRFRGKSPAGRFPDSSIQASTLFSPFSPCDSASMRKAGLKRPIANGTATVVPYSSPAARRPPRARSAMAAA